MPVIQSNTIPGPTEVPPAIDMHAHLYSNISGDDPIDPDEHLEIMDHAGIERTVIATIDGLIRDASNENDRLAQWTSEGGDRFIPYCSLDLRRPGAVDELRRSVLDLGCVGVKIHGWLQGVRPSETSVRQVAEASIDLGLPMMFHDGTPPDSTPLQIGWLAEQYPELTVILGHGGLFDLWPDAIAAAQRSVNCYICLCGTAPPGVFDVIISQVPTEQIVIGTDGGYGPFSHHLVPFRMSEFRSIELADEDREAIFRGNAMRILKLASTAG